MSCPDSLSSVGGYGASLGVTIELPCASSIGLQLSFT